MPQSFGSGSIASQPTTQHAIEVPNSVFTNLTNSGLSDMQARTALGYYLATCDPSDIVRVWRDNTK